MFFELELDLCERFPSLTPFELRETKAYEVFLLIRRLNKYSKKRKRKNNKRKIRKPAGDDWF